ncbi:CPBP family intramembrane glutamic endopeptidase [Aeromicrobium wangtongii]|uniref:CPBP family intramembrane metalloprotease n=1 Tax=Aeromicrobium wangtongii TaxID=2969247 RepID=A0ABY5M1G7_9ACTN|nr:CPBP family intramembrane glutamic endopeptidase [Aeromicrobium wangtongii]MCD9198018.1 CPBP family intramembrane metalloprotease [Aeromicrobium wangtongii]UUP12060.1 CPBP family intramembrane metalloprotease [Aeromicrobium wangtongii]
MPLLSSTFADRIVSLLPRELVDKVPRDHLESDEAFHRRRRVVGAVSLTGAALLGRSLSTEPDSKQFYALTMGVAATWTAGAFASGPLHLGWEQDHDEGLRRPLVTPVVMGAAAFGAFYGAALVARRIPVLNRALTNILAFADQGSAPLVTMTTFANGAAEEVFFRGALYAAAGTNHPVVKSTAVYTLATTATRNPALVLAGGAMGTLLGLQRRASGGIQAPMLTHLTWSALMLRFMPPLFRKTGAETVRPGQPPQV